MVLEHESFEDGGDNDYCASYQLIHTHGTIEQTDLGQCCPEEVEDRGNEEESAYLYLNFFFFQNTYHGYDMMDSDKHKYTIIIHGIYNNMRHTYLL